MESRKKNLEYKQTYASDTETDEYDEDETGSEYDSIDYYHFLIPHPIFSDNIKNGIFENDPYTIIYECGKKNFNHFNNQSSEEPEEILVFIVHGIGQNDQKLKSILNDRIKVMINLLYNHDPTNFNKSIHLRMIDWKTPLFEREKDVFDHLVDKNNKSKFPKNFIQNVPLDLMQYMSERNKYKIINDVVSQLNSYYHLVQKHRKNFKGNVSIISHSLGSVIMYQVLSNMTIDESYRQFGLNKIFNVNNKKWFEFFFGDKKSPIKNENIDNSIKDDDILLDRKKRKIPIKKIKIQDDNENHKFDILNEEIVKNFNEHSNNGKKILKTSSLKKEEERNFLSFKCDSNISISDNYLSLKNENEIIISINNEKILNSFDNRHLDLQLPLQSHNTLISKKNQEKDILSSSLINTNSKINLNINKQQEKANDSILIIPENENEEVKNTEVNMSNQKILISELSENESSEILTSNLSAKKRNYFDEIKNTKGSRYSLITNINLLDIKEKKVLSKNKIKKMSKNLFDYKRRIYLQSKKILFTQSSANMEDEKNKKNNESTNFSEDNLFGDNGKYNDIDDEHFNYHRMFRIYSKNKNILPMIFSIEHFFTLGSPLSLFLTIEYGKNRYLYEMETIKDFHNILHPMDPVAYRIEHLIFNYDEGDSSCLLPHFMTKGIKNHFLNSLFNFVFCINDNNREFYSNYKKRYDYMVQESLPEKTISLIGFLLSHMKYWNNPDVFYFILDVIHNK